MSGDEDFIANKRQGRMYAPREFPIGRNKDIPARYLSTVLDDGTRGHLERIEDELVIRQTSSGKQQIKALVTMDDRQIRHLYLQRWRLGQRGETPIQQAYFTLNGPEIDALLRFALVAKTAEFSGTDKVRLDENAVEQFGIDPAAAKLLLRSNPEVLAQLVENEDLERDVVAITYRRKELEKFQRMLDDVEYFDSVVAEVGRGPEEVWQRFFDQNRWIFGGGLFLVATHGFDSRKLEQTVVGASIAHHGKRADALLRTKGRIGALCFVEIKTHATKLMKAKPYRPSAWAMSDELAGAIAQVQKTVDLAERSLGRVLQPKDDAGAPTGETAFLIRPRSVVVCGNLAEFQAEHGITEEKYASFELLRRHLIGPEVITFDELLERARLIVEEA